MALEEIEGLQRPARRAPRIPRKMAVVISALVAGAAALVAVSARLAWSTRGEPYPGVFFDPFAVVSSVPILERDAAESRTRHPDHIVAVDGEPIGGRAQYGDLPGARILARVAALHRAGRSEVRLSLDTASGPREVRRPILVLEGLHIGVYFIVYGLTALFILWAGVMVLILAGRRGGGIAFACWSVSSATFLCTFYDYHTTARLAPGFFLSSIGVELSFLWLAYWFPEPPRRGRRALLAPLVGVSAVGAAIGGWLVTGPLLNADTALARRAVEFFIPVSFLVLIGGALARLRGSTGRARLELRSAAWGFIGAPALLVLTFLLGTYFGQGVVHLLLPLLAVVIPLSIGVALIRHNILATSALLTRRLMIAPMILFAALGAVTTWLLVEWLAHGTGSIAASAVVAGAVVLGGSRLSSRLFFPAGARFAPTVEQLSDRLASLRAVAEVDAALTDVVRRWLAVESVQLIYLDDLPTIGPLPIDAAVRLRSGARVWTDESPPERRLLVPLRSLGEVRGVLLLAPKYHGALYTDEEVRLLESIANLGAVALHHCQALEQLEDLRRLEADASRGEKRLALGVVAAEVSHEVVLPLNYFERLLKRLDQPQPLDPKDIEIGTAELGRLRRMLDRIEKLQIPAPNLEPVVVSGPLTHSLGLLHDQIGRRSITVENEVPARLVVRADKDHLHQLFNNLLRNAIEAAGADGAVGVRSMVVKSGIHLQIWNSGPGIPDTIRKALFNEQVTTKPGGQGLGLKITFRVVRELGWDITHDRDGDRTVFTIQVPDKDVLPCES